jgi:hypothetical protein
VIPEGGHFSGRGGETPDGTNLEASSFMRWLLVW